MFWLLPENHRKKLIREYRLRLAIMFFLSLNILAVCALIFFIPVYTKVHWLQKNASFVENNLESNIKSENNPSVSKAVEDIKSNMNIAALDNRSAVSPIIAVIQVKNSGIAITSFVYSYNSSGSSLAVSGVATDRQALTDFKNNLESQKIFETVDLPISNFAKDSDLPFSLTVTGTF